MLTLSLNAPLSNPAIFCLHKLAKQVYLQTGSRYRLNHHHNLLRLLKCASRNSDRHIQHWYAALLKHLSIEQLKTLVKLGIRLPAKIAQLLQENTFLKEATLTKGFFGFLAKLTGRFSAL